MSEDGAAEEVVSTKQEEFSARVSHEEFSCIEVVAAVETLGTCGGGICARSQGILVFSPLCFLSASLLFML